MARGISQGCFLWTFLSLPRCGADCNFLLGQGKVCGAACWLHQQLPVYFSSILSFYSSSYCLTTNLASGYVFFPPPPKLRDAKVLSNLKYHPPGCQKTAVWLNPCWGRNLAWEDVLLRGLFLLSRSRFLPIL